MTEEEKKEIREFFRFQSTVYFETFTNFFKKTGNLEQAYRLTKDMFSAVIGGASGGDKKDSLSIFWDK